MLKKYFSQSWWILSLIIGLCSFSVGGIIDSDRNVIWEHRRSRYQIRQEFYASLIGKERKTESRFNEGVASLANAYKEYHALTRRKGFTWSEVEKTALLLNTQDSADPASIDRRKFEKQMTRYRQRLELLDKYSGALIDYRAIQQSAGRRPNLCSRGHPINKIREACQVPLGALLVKPEEILQILVGKRKAPVIESPKDPRIMGSNYAAKWLALGATIVVLPIVLLVIGDSAVLACRRSSQWMRRRNVERLLNPYVYWGIWLSWQARRKVEQTAAVQAISLELASQRDHAEKLATRARDARRKAQYLATDEERKIWAEQAAQLETRLGTAQQGVAKVKQELDEIMRLHLAKLQVEQALKEDE